MTETDVDTSVSAYRGDGPYVFVCYAHEDQAPVFAEMRRLNETGVNVWYDEGIAPGSEWTQELADAIEGCRQLVFFVSGASVESRHCRNEVQYALDRGKPVVAVYLEDTELPGGLQLAIGLTQAIHKHALAADVYADKMSRALSERAPVEAMRVSDDSGRGVAVWVLAAFGLFAACMVALVVLWPRDAEEPADFDTAAYEEYLQARDYLRRWPDPQVLDQAEIHFNAAIALDDRFARAHAGLCETHLGRYRQTRAPEHLGRAESACFRAVALDSEAWEVQFSYAALLGLKGDRQTAIQNLERALESAPGQAVIHAELGKLYCRASDLQTAEAYFDAAVEREPGYWAWRFDAGNCYFRLESFEQAISAFEEALVLSPVNSVYALNNIGSANFYLDDVDAAERAWRQSVSVSDTSTAREGLGALYYYQGCPLHAAGEFARATELDPGKHRLWGQFAEACRLVPGGETRAASAMQRAIQLANREADASDWNTIGYLGKYNAAVGAAELAAEARTALLELNADTHLAWYLAAMIDYRLGDVEQGDAARARAIELGMPERMFSRDPELAEMSCPLEPLATSVCQRVVARE